MTTYTPNQPVTVIDAKGVRGPGIMHQVGGDLFACEVGFRHTLNGGNEWPAGGRWNFFQHETADYGLRILPEPFTEPKGEEEADRYERFLISEAARSSKGDSDKPLTAEELDALDRMAVDATLALCAADITQGPPRAWLTYRGALFEAAPRLLSMARSSLPGEVPAGRSGDYRQAVQEFEAFVSEPPPYEDQRMVRDYRHELYPRWRKIVQAFEAALSSAPDALSTTAAGLELADPARALDWLEWVTFEGPGASIDDKKAAFATLRTAIANTQGG